MTLNDLECRHGRYVALFFIMLDHGRAIFLPIAKLLVTIITHCCRSYFEHWLSFLGLDFRLHFVFANGAVIYVCAAENITEILRFFCPLKLLGGSFAKSA